MRPKLSLLFICLICLIGCLPTQEPVAVTRPVVGTEMPTGGSTAVPPTHTPPPTATQVAVATATPTNTALPTSTPKPAWPTTPILFVRDGALQRWLPQTNEVEMLVDGVNYPIYAPDIVVFFRETKPQEEYALSVFHIPTRTEVELLRQPAGEIRNALTGETRYVPPETPITVSENGRWLAYVLQDEVTGIFTLFAHEIKTSTQGVALSQVIFSRELPMRFKWPYAFLTWSTANELSWMEPDGIWIAKLDEMPITSELAILASTNMAPVYPMDPAKQDQGPQWAATTYIPSRWSPDGRFLLAIERFPSEGQSHVFQIIERGSNNKFQLPDSAIGELSDRALWLDQTRVLHFRFNGLVRIWQIPLEGEFLPKLESEFEAIPGYKYLEAENLLPLPNNHLRFSDTSGRGLYDLDLATQKTLIIGDNYATRHLWSPSGQYALWINYSNQGEAQVLLDFLNKESPTDMSQILGMNSCCWYWEPAGSE